MKDFCDLNNQGSKEKSEIDLLRLRLNQQQKEIDILFQQLNSLTPRVHTLFQAFHDDGK